MNSFIKKYSPFFILIGLLLFFIIGFNILSRIIEISNEKSQQIVLDDSLFQEDSFSTNNSNLEVKNVKKMVTPYPIWDLSIIDNEHLLYTTFNSTSNEAGFKLVKMSFNDQSTIELQKDLFSGESIILPNGTKLLYSVFNRNEEKSKVHLYDIKNKKIESTYDGEALLFLPEQEAFLGLDGTTLFIQGLKTNKKQSLYSLTFNDTYTSVQTKINKKNIAIENERVFVGEMAGNQSSISMIDLEKDAIVSKFLRFDYIQDFDVIDENLLITGMVSGQEGLYSYNLKTKNMHNLLKGSISSFDVTSDGRLAYILVRDDGVSELYCATYQDEEIRHKKQIYMDSNYVNFLQWNTTSNMLFYSSGNGNGNDLIRFTF